MASEVRVNSITNRSGLGTVTFNENASHDGIKVQGAIGIGSFTTAVRNAGIGTADGTLIYNSTAEQIEAYGPLGWKNVVSLGFVATGGTKDTTSRSGFAVHTFTEPGSLVVEGSRDVEMLVIGGGGGGSASIPGYWAGSGGGAGGMVEVSSYSLSDGTYPITVGGGGNGSVSPGPETSDQASNGTSSSFNNPGNTPQSVIANGGGGGGGSGTAGVTQAQVTGGSGGSGGGSGSSNVSPSVRTGGTVSVHPNIPGISGATHYGNAGGDGENGTNGEGAGGGGAGGAGTSSDSPYSPLQNNPGGPGRANSITGSPVTYAAGGGAGPTAGAGTNGSANTGNGGGGGANPSAAEPGGNGGSGIVIIAYPIS